MICNECETVAHCTSHGCIPKTTKKDEAMKLALEALESGVDGQTSIEMDEASTALREALAEQPAQQEPAAWIEHDDETAEPCPSCGKPLQSASGGGVVCSERCGYWFCF
jgi:hypothetical protein